MSKEREFPSERLGYYKSLEMKNVYKIKSVKNI